MVAAADRGKVADGIVVRAASRRGPRAAGGVGNAQHRADCHHTGAGNDDVGAGDNLADSCAGGLPVDRGDLQVAADVGRSVNEERVGARVVRIDAHAAPGADKELVVRGRCECGVCRIGPNKSAIIVGLRAATRGEGISASCAILVPARDGGPAAAGRVFASAADRGVAAAVGVLEAAADRGALAAVDV